MAKIVIPSISSGFAATSVINDNFQTLVDELQDKVLYRDNPVGEPNQMENDLDINNNNLLNVATINGIDASLLTDLSGTLAAAEGFANDAASSTIAAAGYATQAEGFSIASQNSSVSAAASAVAANLSEINAAAYASIGFDVASTIYDFGFITDASLTFTTDYGSVV